MTAWTWWSSCGARLDEDERAARQEDKDCAGTTLLPTYDSEHQARWNTARVLAEVEAKRRIADEHHPVDPCDAHDAEMKTVPCPTLRLLALPYADRPGYRDEWRP